MHAVPTVAVVPLICAPATATGCPTTALKVSSLLVGGRLD